MISSLRIFLSRFNSNPWFLFSQAFLLFLLSNGILSQFVCRKDLSESKRFEVSESTRKIFQDLRSPVYIDAYYSSKIPGEYRTRLDLTKELLSEIASLGGSNAVLRFHDPDTSVEEQKKRSKPGFNRKFWKKRNEVPPKSNKPFSV